MSSFIDSRAHIETDPDQIFKATLFDRQGLIVGLNTVAPGQSQPVHRHPDQDKFYYVVEGSGDFVVGEETQTAGPGLFVRVAAGVDHGVQNNGSEPLVLLVGMTPSPTGGGPARRSAKTRSRRMPTKRTRRAVIRTTRKAEKATTRARKAVKRVKKKAKKTARRAKAALGRAKKKATKTAKAARAAAKRARKAVKRGTKKAKKTAKRAKRAATRAGKAVKRGTKTAKRTAKKASRAAGRATRRASKTAKRVRKTVRNKIAKRK